MTSERVRHQVGLIDVEEVKRLAGGSFSVSSYGFEHRMLLFGESHRDNETEKLQSAIVRLIKPDFVLDEKLGGWNYDPHSRRFQRQTHRLFDNADDSVVPNLPFKLIETANELGFSIIGCDLTDGEIKRYGRLLPNLFPDLYFSDGARIIKLTGHQQQVLYFDELSREPYIIRMRDAQIVRTARKYERKSTSPIVQVVGAAHGTNINNQQLLSKKFPGYVYVTKA